MPIPTDISYIADPVVAPDGTVEFTCSQDVEAWPWLELPPYHPIVIQTQCFWVSIGGALARGTLDPTRWSALTWDNWHTRPTATKHAARGRISNIELKGDDAFEIMLWDEDGGELCDLCGKGVVFRTRDFEGWRAGAKSDVGKNGPAPTLDYAPRSETGVPEGEFSLISRLTDDAKPSATGLITAENGLPPASRHLTGSGDHVNATHLAECARQFAALYEKDPGVIIAGGDCRFVHYVEIGSPFRVDLNNRDLNYMYLTVSQAGRDCSYIQLEIH